MKKKVLLFVCLFVTVLSLTGCGSVGISKEMNNIVKSVVDSAEEKGYFHTFTLSEIQSTLNSNGLNYQIIAAGDSSFTASVTDTTYVERINGYNGSLYDSSRMLESDHNVKYCLVLDKNSGKYYNIKITYKNIKFNGTNKEYPYFETEKQVK